MPGLVIEGTDGGTWSAAREVPALRERVAALKAEVAWARASRELIDWDAEESEFLIESERESVRESRLAMKHIRELFPSETTATGVLRPLVTSLSELTQVVQELHTLAVVKAETTPVAPSGP